MASAVRVLLSLVVLTLFGLSLWQLGIWPELPGAKLQAALRESRHLADRLTQAHWRLRAQTRVQVRLLAGELSLRAAAREALELCERQFAPLPDDLDRWGTPEVCCAAYLVRGFEEDPALVISDRTAVLARLRRELAEMQQAGR